MADYKLEKQISLSSLRADRPLKWSKSPEAALREFLKGNHEVSRRFEVTTSDVDESGKASLLAPVLGRSDVCR